MSFDDAFPDDLLEEIRKYPGNDKCCDCPSLSTDWASVSNGTLICLDCAGKHRSLGVQVSFVRSITMDTWSRRQIEMIVQGGNGQIKRFFEKVELLNCPIQILYTHRAAAHYREKLKEKVDKILAGVLKNDRRQRAFSRNEKVPSSVKQRTNLQDIHYDAIFGEGTMGMTLTKHRGRAIVSKVLVDGAASRNGVVVGDYIVGVMGKGLEEYDEIMQLVTENGRPIKITFLRHSKDSPKRQDLLQHSLSESSFYPSETVEKAAMEADNSLSVGNRSNSERVAHSSNRKSPRSFGFEENHSNSDNDVKVLKKIKSQFTPTTPVAKQLELKSVSSETSKSTRGSTVQDISSDNGSPKVIPDLDAQSTKQFQTAVHINGDSSPRLDIIQQLPALDVSNNPPIRTEEFLVGGQSPELNFRDMGKIINKIDESLSDLDKLSPRQVNSHDPSLDELENSFEQKLRNIIEVGGIYKVFRPEEDQWRTAIIKRIHRDGSFKVIFRDGSTEGHVISSRIAIPANRLRGRSQEPLTPDFSVLLRDDGQPASNDNSADLEEVLNQEGCVTPDRRIDDTNEFMEGWLASNEPNELNALLSKQIVDSNDLTIRIDGFISPQRNVRGIYCVTFPQPPLGITITESINGEPQITRVKTGSVGDRNGVVVGDLLTHIENYPVRTYEEAMNIIPYSSYPLTLCIKKRETTIKSFDPYGSLEAEAARIKKLKLSHDDISVVSPDTSLNRKLSLFPVNPLEFDVVVIANEVSFEIQEVEGRSIVTSVVDGSSDETQGLVVGCEVIGINYEPVSSHSHTITVLKEGKRPLTLRFRQVI